MYKYKCTAEANADKEAFYSVVGELKKLYPELSEDNNVPSDNEFLRREFVQGKKRVMVLYSFSERSVTVFSKEWLGKFYEDREAAEGRFPEYSAVSTGTMWKISGGFFAGSALAAFFFYFIFLASFYGSEKIILITILALTAIYTVSGIIIRRSVEIPLLKLIFYQAGGFITVIAGVIALNVLVFELFFYINIDFIWIIAFPFLTYSTSFAMVFLPALELSLLLQAVIGLIMKKIHSSEADAEENIAENNE